MPDWIHSLPTVNAGLNALGTLFLLSGYAMIRQRRINAHRACMLAAFACSVAFLTSYLTYHYYAGSTPFPHPASVGLSALCPRRSRASSSRVWARSAERSRYEASMVSNDRT